MDESRATLAIYGDDLDPEAMTKRLGHTPKHSHRKGASVGSVPAQSGAWLFTVEARPPLGPDDALIALLDTLSLPSAEWIALQREFRVLLRIAIHMDGWNRGFGLSTQTVQRVATIGLPIDFDLYFDGEPST